MQKRQVRITAGAIKALLLIAVLASSCAPRLRSNIAVYHSLPQRAEGAAYAFMTLTDQEAARENSVYRKSIKEELLRHGYREAPRDEASLVVAFSYSVDQDPGQGPRGREGEAGGDAYSRKLWIYVMDKRSANGDAMHVLYEGNVISFGSAAQLGKAMPFMIRALLQEFPGSSGSLRTEYIAVD